MNYTTDDALANHVLPLMVACMKIRHHVSMEFVRLRTVKDNEKVLSDAGHVNNITTVLDEVVVLLKDVVAYAGSASLISYSMFMRAKKTYEYGYGCQYEGEAKDVVITRNDMKTLKDIGSKLSIASFDQSCSYIDDIINEHKQNKKK